MRFRHTAVIAQVRDLVAVVDELSPCEAAFLVGFIYLVRQFGAKWRLIPKQLERLQENGKP
jgi:hypothetical protein